MRLPLLLLAVLAAPPALLADSISSTLLLTTTTSAGSFPLSNGSGSYTLYSSPPSTGSETFSSATGLQALSISVGQSNFSLAEDPSASLTFVGGTLASLNYGYSTPYTGGQVPPSFVTFDSSASGFTYSYASTQSSVSESGSGKVTSPLSTVPVPVQTPYDLTLTGTSGSSAYDGISTTDLFSGTGAFALTGTPQANGISTFNATDGLASLNISLDGGFFPLSADPGASVTFTNGLFSGINYNFTTSIGPFGTPPNFYNFDASGLSFNFTNQGTNVNFTDAGAGTISAYAVTAPATSSSVTPEPGSFTFLATGAAALFGLARRRLNPRS